MSGVNDQPSMSSSQGPSNQMSANQILPTWRMEKAVIYQVRSPILGPRHRHSQSFQVFELLEGEGSIMIGDQEYKAGLGGIFWIPPGVEHSSEDQPESCPKMLEIRFQRNPQSKLPFDPMIFPYHIKSQSYPVVSQLLRQIVNEFWARSNYWEWTVSALTEQFLIETARVVASCSELGDRRVQGYRIDPECIDQAINYIHAHFAEPIDLNTLASVAQMSVSRFGKTFLAVNGMRPIEYLVDFRLQRSLEMMAEQRWTFTQIAEAVGFGSVHHFSRSFKKCFGVSPSTRASLITSDIQQQISQDS